MGGRSIIALIQYYVVRWVINRWQATIILKQNCYFKTGVAVRQKLNKHGGARFDERFKQG